MRGRTVFQALCLASALLCGCESRPSVSVTAAPGVSIPNVDDLAQKLDGSLSGAGMKMYVKENGRLIEVKPSRLTKPLSAVVRSFDPKTCGSARVSGIQDAGISSLAFQRQDLE
jgi:hypothetical protein